MKEESFEKLEKSNFEKSMSYLLELRGMIEPSSKIKVALKHTH